MYYLVKLVDADRGGAIENVYVRAGTIVEAIERALRYAEREYATTPCRVAAVAESDIVVVEDGDDLTDRPLTTGS